MKRLLIYFGAAGLVMGVAFFACTVAPKIRARPLIDEPLRVTVGSFQPANSNVAFDHYVVRVENVGTKPIRGFSLGQTCRCQSWDRDNNPYPHGISYTNPLPEWQVLQPGDTLYWPFSSDDGSPPNVWVDLVHFANDGNWGPNRSRTDAYVRGY